jgi:choline dehydrogenase
MCDKSSKHCSKKCTDKHSKHCSKQCTDKCFVGSYDYIIVGGGTAGCALARKLSDDFTKSVLVIEAGDNLSNDPAVLGNNLFASIPLGLNPKYSKVYQANFTPGNYVAYSDGRMLGGGSGHNGLQCYRGTPDVYNQWAIITGDPRWNYNNLLTNVFIPMENYTPNGTIANPAQRGTAGPLFISQEPPLNTDPVMVALGIAFNSPQVPDLNDPSITNVGIGANQDWATPPFLGANSIRCFSANAYLTGIPSQGVAPVIRPNGQSIGGRQLTVMFEANCNRVLFDKFNNAIGVEYVSTKTKRMIRTKAKQRVILCAGSIQDAAILQRSGVGDQTLLQTLGIPVVFANSNVGANMQNHYGAVSVISGSTTVNIPRVGSGFTDLSPAMSAGTRRMQLFVVDAVYLPAGITQALGLTTGVSIIGINVTPGSLGNVQIINQDPFTEPQVNLNFYSDGPSTTNGTDAFKTVTFYKTIKQMATNMGRTVLFPTPADYANGDAALLSDATNSAPIGAYHNSGTCRMATSAATGVCDSNLHVFGVNKLMVADCAVSPLIEDGNTAYQAFAIGLEAALIIQAGL